MSTEGAAKAPPEHGEESPPIIDVSESTDDVAAVKPKNKKMAAYDKKWLENFETLKPCIREGGNLDYSALDEETQKKMQSYVKDQRKCYRKRENNEPTPMTDYRYNLLAGAGFNFKPSETNKGNDHKYLPCGSR